MQLTHDRDRTKLSELMKRREHNVDWEVYECKNILPSVLTRTPYICSPPNVELCIRAAYKDAWFNIGNIVVYK